MKLFTAFNQADASTTRKFGGTGLGLAISKQLVELMGGKISVTSELGEGSKFQFNLSLPIFAVKMEPIPVNINFSDLRVLVVDDIHVNLDIISKRLSDWHIRSDTASSGLIAIEYLNKAIADNDPFQLVLTDYHMPEMSGAQLIEKVKTDPLIEKTKFVLLSSLAGMRGDAKRFKNLGFSGYLSKPIHLNILHEILCMLWKHIQNGTEPAQLISRHTVSEALAINEADTEIDNDIDTIVYKVLLVEDNIVNQKVAKKILEICGCKGDVAANGKEGVEMHQQFPYDIIFMDCQMPIMDGFEATKAIRDSEIKSDRHQVIIAMTANAIEGDRDNCISKGMDDYISKPIDRDRLNTMILKWHY